MDQPHTEEVPEILGEETDEETASDEELEELYLEVERADNAAIVWALRQSKLLLH